MRLFTLRGPVLRMPWPLVILAWGALMIRNTLRWLAVHTAVTGTLVLAVLLWWVIDRTHWLVLAGATALILTGMGAGVGLQPRWWRRLSAAAHSWQRHREYLRIWQDAMDGTKLSRLDAVPELGGHRFAGVLGETDTDVLTVHMLAGQLVSDWRAQAPRLAAAFGVQRVRAHAVPGVPGDVLLHCRRYRDPASIPDRTPVPLSTPVEDPVEDGRTEDVEQAPRGAFPRNPRSTA